MLYPGGICLACFLNLLLLSKRGKTIADKILVAWLLIITVHLLSFYFFSVELYPQLLGGILPLPLMHGPFLYLYTKALTSRKFSLLKSMIHFIPAIAVLVYLVPFF